MVLKHLFSLFVRNLHRLVLMPLFGQKKEFLPISIANGCELYKNVILFLILYTVMCL